MVFAGTDAELAMALSSTANPLVVQLSAAPGSTYMLSQTYTYSNRAVCIQVRARSKGDTLGNTLVLVDGNELGSLLGCWEGLVRPRAWLGLAGGPAVVCV